MNWLEVYKVNETLQVFSLVVAFLILFVFGHRGTWFATDSIILILIGLAYTAIPRQVVQAQTIGSCGLVEENLGRYLGISIICAGIQVIKSKDSSDHAVAISTLLSRCFTSSTLLILQGISYMSLKPLPKPNKNTFDWSEQILTIELFATFLWSLGNLLMLLKSKDFYSFNSNNLKVNFHLRLDAILEIMFAILLLAFPGKIVSLFSTKSGNKISTHLIRTVGAFKLGNGIQSLEAPLFANFVDKRDIFFIRIFNCLLNICYLLLVFYIQNIPSFSFYLVFLFNLPSLFNSIVGSLKRPVPLVDIKNKKD